MSDEDLLRSGLATLGTDPPSAGDRVAAVGRRVRRQSRVRAAAGGVVAATAVLGTAAVLVLTGAGAGRDELPAMQPPTAGVDAGTGDYRVTITQAMVTVPGATYDQTLALVSQALGPLTLPDHVSRSPSAAKATGPVRTDFVRALDASERGRVRDVLSAVPGAQVTLRDVAGFNLRLVAPLSAQVRAEVLARGELVPSIGSGPLADALGGIVGVTPDEDARRLIVIYNGPALTEQALATARSEVARLAGVPLEQVRLERNSPADGGFSYELGGSRLTG